MEPIDLIPTEPEVADALVAPSGPLKALKDLSSDERYEWKKTGTRPPVTPVEPSDDEEEPQAPIAAKVGDTTAPDVPVVQPPHKLSKRQQQINDLHRQNAEKDAELARLRAFQSMRSAPPLRSEPQRSAPAQPTTVEGLIARPDINRAPLSEQEFFQQFPQAPYSYHGAYLARYFGSQDEAQTQQRSQQDAQTRAYQQQSQTFAERTVAAKAKYPEFEAKTLALATQMSPDRGPIESRVFHSPVGHDLLMHFATHPEDLQRLYAIPSKHASADAAVAEILAEVGKLEAKFDTPAAPAQTGPSPLVTAPEPPTALTGRPDPADPALNALKRRDFLSYQRVRNDADLARRRSR